MSRRGVSLVVLSVVLGLMLWLLPEVPLLVFAATLLGVFLFSGGKLLRRVVPVSNGAAVGLFILILLLTSAAIGMIAARPIADQLNELWQQVPTAAASLAERLSHYRWGQELLSRLQSGNISLPSGGGTTAFTALNSTLGALANLVLVVFLGLYFALDPALYRRGIEALLAPSLRPRARVLAEEAAATLRGWLGAQLICMAVIGSLTGIGLWLVGVPLAPVLGLIAALLAFIPTVGPVLSAVPGVLLGLAQGPQEAMAVVGVYLAVQSVESYLVTPYVQRRNVDLPEAVTIVSLLAFGLIYGFLGMLLATPLAAVMLMLVKRIYVEGYLEAEPEGQKGVILRG